MLSTRVSLGALLLLTQLVVSHAQKNTAYLTYYSDDKCTKLAATRGAVSDNNFTIQVTPASVTCAEAMYCFLNVDGPSCMSLGLSASDVSNVVVTVNETGVFECDDTNNATIEPQCSWMDPESCTKSSSQGSCYFRWTSYDFLVANPAILNGALTSMGSTLKASLSILSALGAAAALLVL